MSFVGNGVETLGTLDHSVMHEGIKTQKDNKVGETILSKRLPFIVTYQLTVGHASARTRSPLEVASTGWAYQMETQPSLQLRKRRAWTVNLLAQLPHNEQFYYILYCTGTVKDEALSLRCASTACCVVAGMEEGQC